MIYIYIYHIICMYSLIRPVHQSWLEISLDGEVQLMAACRISGGFKLIIYHTELLEAKDSSIQTCNTL